MDSQIIEVIVLNDPAGAADAVLATGNMTLNGSKYPIPLSQMDHNNPYDYTAYAAGTAQVMDVNLAASGYTASQVYHLIITTFPGNPPDGIVPQDPQANATYTIPVIANSTDTGTARATQFAAYINAGNDAGGFPFTAVGGTNKVTITCDDATFQIIVRSDDVINTGAGTSIVTSLTITTPYVKPSGTYALVSSLSPDVVSSETYSQYTFNWFVPEDAAPYMAVGIAPKARVRTILLFDSADGQSAALITQINAIIAGTSTTALYLGAGPA